MNIMPTATPNSFKVAALLIPNPPVAGSAAMNKAARPIKP